MFRSEGWGLMRNPAWTEIVLFKKNTGERGDEEVFRSEVVKGVVRNRACPQLMWF